MLLVDGIHMLVNVIIVDPIQLYFISRATLFRGVVATWRFIKKKDFIEIGILKTCFSLLPLMFLGVYINKPANVFIVVLTWHE